MLVPIKWIKDYTDINVPVKEFVDRMVMSGSNLETVEYFGEEITNVVIGKILSVDKHPAADKLVVCKVDVGQASPVQIVTGAANVFPGAVIAVALDGAHIPGPLHGQPKKPEGDTIRTGSLRGVESQGMMCGCEELGFDAKVVPVRDKDGIWLFDEDYKPGTDVVEALELKDAVVDFEITPNRPDCLSMIGMAREASATLGTPLRYPETECKKVSPEKSADYISVEIKRPDLCKRYCCRVIKDIKIAQSPWWMQRALIYSGMRPINNIVDITNFVMLEYGQPLHAFDVRTVRGGKIVVDTCPEGTIFKTLDGQERKLTDTMLTINDAEGPMAVAGVMGGLNSEIEADTKTVLVESANFLGDSVRATSKKLGLRTEASSRFEKGIDPNLAKDACDRFCYLVELLGAGTVLTGDVDVYPNPETAKTIDIRPERISLLMGVDVTADEIIKLISPLEIKCEKKGGVISVTPPTVRQDLAIEEDYVEEVSRMYGYDKLPVTIPKNSEPASITEKQASRNLAKRVLTALGLSEFQTYSFVSPKSVDKVMVPADSIKRRFIKLINPLGEDTSVMRTTLLANMLDSLKTNYSRSNAAVRAFELGNTFFDNGKGGDGLPEERDSLCIGCYGEGESFYTLKGVLEELFKVFGIKDVEYVAESENAAYHPGRCARAVKDGADIAVFGQLSPDVAGNYDIDCEVYAAEVDFEELFELSDTEKKYRPLPKFPALTRDFSMVVAESVKVGELEKLIAKTAGDLLESVELFDVYRGAPILAGFKSVAFSLTYRAKDRTLTDPEVNAINETVLAELNNTYKAVLREI